MKTESIPRPVIELQEVGMGYGPPSSRTEVLKDTNLKIWPNEFVAIIGFSGSGKSTLVSLMAGLQNPDEGYVFYNNREMTGPGPERGVMFQNYSLLPWLTVYGNIEMAVRQVFPKMPSAQRKAHVAHYIEMVNLTPARDKRPAELSGGMRQRVSLARTLATKPEVLLLDEPLSALDAITRANLQDEIVKIWEKDKRTVVMITNDVDEALLMADRIIPLTKGPVATLAKPFEVKIDRPRCRTTINQDPQFMKLRHDITQFLLSMEGGDEVSKDKSPQSLVMPNLQPIDFTAA